MVNESTRDAASRRKNQALAQMTEVWKIMPSSRRTLEELEEEIEAEAADEALDA